MANFVIVKSGASTRVLINVERVTYFAENEHTPDKCTVHFDNGNAVIVDSSAAEIITRADKIKQIHSAPAH